ncbi:MAG: hypothetical protein MUO54_05785, partial [Anaerolineales bacterium]|nr:hypothetical protein [Anaerolineales bacterium]
MLNIEFIKVISGLTNTISGFSISVSLGLLALSRRDENAYNWSIILLFTSALVFILTNIFGSLILSKIGIDELYKSSIELIKYAQYFPPMTLFGLLLFFAGQIFVFF